LWLSAGGTFDHNAEALQQSRLAVYSKTKTLQLLCHASFPLGLVSSLQSTASFMHGKHFHLKLSIVTFGITTIMSFKLDDSLLLEF
jgi:hypothetical protein